MHRPGGLGGRRPLRPGPPRRPLRRTAAQRLRRHPRPAQRPLPQRRVRRAAPAHRVGPRHRGALRAPRRPAAGRHQRRHHPRPRTLRRLPRRREGRAASASSTRRWSTSRGSATSSPWARPAGASRTSPTTGCWSPRRPGIPGRLPFWKGDTLGRPAELGEAIGASPASWAPRPDKARRQARERGLDEYAAGNLVTYVTEQQEATNALPSDPSCWSSASATSSATGAWSSTRRTAPRCTRRGRWPSTPGCASATASTGRPWPPTTASCIRIPDTEDEPPGGDIVVFEPDEIEQTRHPGGRRLRAVRQPASASAPPARCCSPAATPDAAARCGSSASAAPSCSRSPRSTPRSRSSSRRSASASRTSTTCPRWSG